MTADGNRPAIGLIADRFDSRRRPSREEAQEHVPGQGRTVSQREPHAVACVRSWSMRGASATA